MSYDYGQTPCPKCGFSSSNPDICDACGALISRVRERQQAEYNAQEQFAPQGIPPLSDDVGARLSLTAKTVIIALVAAGGFYYYHSRSADEPVVEEVEVAAKPSRSILFETTSKSPSAVRKHKVDDKPAKEAAASDSKSVGIAPKEVFGLIAEKFKAQNQEAKAPTAEPAEPLGTATPVEANPQVSAPTEKTPLQPSAPAVESGGRQPSKSTSKDLGAITIGENDLKSGGFSTASSKPASPSTAAAATTESPGQQTATNPTLPANTPAAPATVAVSMINSNSFNAEVLRHSNTPVLVDFYATWCGPCKRLAPSLEELAREHDGTLKVVKLDVDQNQSLCKQYKVTAFPTLVLFKNGREMRRIVGAVPYEQLKAEVNLFL